MNLRRGLSCSRYNLESSFLLKLRLCLSHTPFRWHSACRSKVGSVKWVYRLVTEMLIKRSVTLSHWDSSFLSQALRLPLCMASINWDVKTMIHGHVCGMQIRLHVWRRFVVWDCFKEWIRRQSLDNDRLCCCPGVCRDLKLVQTQQLWTSTDETHSLSFKIVWSFHNNRPPEGFYRPLSVQLLTNLHPFQVKESGILCVSRFW